MNPSKMSRSVLLGVAAVLVIASILVAFRSKPRSGGHAERSNLSLLNSSEPLAKVGQIQLTAIDLRQAMQIDFHDQISHAALSPEDPSLKTSAALQKLIEDELLAQEARKRGLKTGLSGAQGRRDLARRLLEEDGKKLFPLTGAQVRNFYKNHGEKFYIPPGVRVRELFLPLEDTSGSTNKKDTALVLAEALLARIKKGEPLEELAKQHMSAPYLERSREHLFKGGAMDTSEEQRVLHLTPGEVIGPVRVEGGFSIFQGIRRERSRLIPFYQAKEKIKTYLEARRRDDYRRELLSRLEKQIPVQRLSLDPVTTAVQ